VTQAFENKPVCFKSSLHSEVTVNRTNSPPLNGGLVQRSGIFDNRRTASGWDSGDDVQFTSGQSGAGDRLCWCWSLGVASCSARHVIDQYCLSIAVNNTSREGRRGRRSAAAAGTSGSPPSGQLARPQTASTIVPANTNYYYKPRLNGFRNSRPVIARSIRKSPRRHLTPHRQAHALDRPSRACARPHCSSTPTRFFSRFCDHHMYVG